MVRRIMLIFIALGSSLRNRVVSIMMFIEDFDPFEEFDPREEFGPYEDLDPYEEFDLGFLFFTGGVMMTFT